MWHHGGILPSGVSVMAIQTVKSLWNLSATREPNGGVLEAALLASNTPWDRFLRKATPDLPTYLSDWAMTRVRSPERFRSFWAQLFWTVSPMDRLCFKKWLEEEALKLAESSFSLVQPDWMRIE